MAPQRMIGMNEVKGFKRSEIDRAGKALLSAGTIRQEPYGPPSKGKHRLVIVEDQTREG
jgi:hypothetical protein